MDYKYDVAISFSNNDRIVARQIAESLMNRGIHVFFDEFADSNLWGRDLYQYLINVYEQSRLCLVIISESYTKSQWTITEFRNLSAHSRFRESFAILPIVVGKAPTGFLGNIAYVDWSATDAEHISNMVEERLRTLPVPSREKEPDNYHVIMRDSGWSVKRGGTSRATSVHKTKKEAIAAARKIASKHRPTELVIHRQDGSIASRELIKSEEHNADSDK